jgi:hypothetical protein
MVRVASSVETVFKPNLPSTVLTLLASDDDPP